MTAATAKSDPNVRIPPAVKAASARAEKAHKEIYKKEEEPKPDAVAEGTPKEETPAPAPAAEAQPPADPAPAPAPEVTPPSNQPAPENWEHKYNSMKGRYDREHEAVLSLTDRMRSLESVISSMKEEQSEPKPASAPSQQVLITPEEEQDYGAEFLTVVGKKAQQVVGGEVSQLRQKMTELEKKLASVNGFVSQDAQARMHSDLDDKCPDWRTLNNNTDFITWLQLPDTYSGVIRHELLKAAYERNDAPRVLAFFNGFLAEEAAVAPATAGGLPPAAPAPGKVPLADLAAPGRAKSPAATSAPAEKPIISRAQITQFYADAAAGKYRGREAEKLAAEKMIFEAQQSGRIR